MERFLCLSLSSVLMFGILFPVSRTREGKSPFIQQIKSIFHYSSGETTKKETGTKGGPVITDKGESRALQEIKNVFHYFPEGRETPKTKEYPLQFDKMLEKELRYPPEERK